MNDVMLKLLYPLGITANYVGYFYMEQAVGMVHGDPRYLTLVTKRLYPDVALVCGSKPDRVERNLRAIADIAWRTNPGLLEEMAGYPLNRRPCASQFVAIVTASYEKAISETNSEEE